MRPRSAIMFFSSAASAPGVQARQTCPHLESHLRIQVILREFRGEDEQSKSKHATSMFTVGGNV